MKTIRVVTALILSNVLFTQATFADQGDLTYDVGLATGTVNSLSYTEAQIGLNYYFLDFLAWRNAGFYRFRSGASDVVGIDTSLRGILALGGKPLGFTAFAGPGVRFVNQGENAPLVEAGAALKVAGFAIGAGVKTIFNNMVNSRSENDTQIMLILAGAGSL